MVEVEVLAPRLHQPQRHAGRGLERRHAVTLCRRLERKRGEHRLEVLHPQDHPLERPALARAVGVEERQLAELRVDSDQREGVGLLDHVHAEVVAQERGQWPAIVDPEGHVVQAGGFEGRGHSHAFTPGKRFQSLQPPPA